MISVAGATGALARLAAAPATKVMAARNMAQKATTPAATKPGSVEVPAKDPKESVEVSRRALLMPDALQFIDERLVRISRPSKNVMQSGTSYTDKWKIEFDSRDRWENWLMGWTSTGDPLSNLSVTFPTKEDAIAYCERNKLQWYVEEQPRRQARKKSYADNFSWDKRTRTTNK